MSWDFFVPVCVGDLVKTGGINQYVVQDVVPVKQLPSHLSKFKAALRSQGPSCILEHFDTGYSVLQHFNSLELGTKEDALELLVQVVNGLAVSLPTVLTSSSLSAAERKEKLNAVKMSVFLLCKLTESLESFSYRQNIVTAPGKGNKKGKGGEGLLQWDSERESVLQALVQLLQLDIRSLWSLSLVEEEFISCVTCCCYKLLENPTIGHVKNKPTRDCIIHLLGVLITKYNHLLGASVKVIQMLQHFEQLSSVFAQAVSVWSTEYGVRAVIGEVIREIGQKSSEELAREGSGVKAFASFLSEVGGLVPELMIPNISVLITHLEGESHTMRVAVCEVLGEILVRVLCGDGLQESGRADRDRFFDILQEHLHDTHSHVRARVLQVFTRIVNSKALPLCKYSEVMELAVGRLMDKSINAVKSAIQLLAAFIAHNPYSCKLSSADLKKPLEKEMAKLREMKEKLEGKAPVAVIKASELWAAMEPELLVTVRTTLEHTSEAEREQEDEEEGDVEEEKSEDDDDRATAVKIAQYLRVNKYRNAVKLCIKAHDWFPESEMFAALSTVTPESLMDTLGLIFKGSDEDASEDTQNLPPTPQKEGDKEGEDGELKKQEMLVQYLRDTETFSLQVERAIFIINNMLYWKTTSVVQEAVQFCVTVHEFSVANSISGVRKMLPLVWSTDAAIKDAVVQAYRRLYLNPQGDTIRMKAQTLVDNLSELMVDASLGTIQCLEEIVQEFFGSGSNLQLTVIQVLWERFTGKRESSVIQKRAAVLLLGMAARAEREVVLSNLDTLCSVALGEKVTEDFLLARDTAITICSITDHVRQSKGAPFRLPQDHQLFTCLTQAVAEGVVMEDPYWQSFMEQAVRLIYFLAESPDQLCSRLLQRSARLLLDQITEGDEVNKDVSQMHDGSQVSTDQEEQVNCVCLAQLLALCGCVAFWQVSHLERSVSAELRRRRGETEEREEKEKRPGSKAKVANESTMEDELGLIGASAEDTEAELIRKICETELLAEENLLSVFLPLLVKVCSSRGRYSHPQLTTAACLALSQYMMISPSVCEDNIRLMFTVLERSNLPVVRANAIIALGDLTVRFPNILEPWTQNLYARLSDEVPSVRQTAVTVLTQLVLKDVLKVKGQVSEVAVLLIDPEPQITSLALNFFNELATKDNAIYNLLPDIISRLSDPERGMSSEDFNTIMKQLFSYITKERQTESLVEKMCQRFRTAKTERQWCDLATSLSLLSMCERGFKRLQECWECYSDKLTEPGVYQPLLSITAKLRRGAKPQFKSQVDDFEKRLTAVHTRGLENVESPEMDENQGEDGSAEKTSARTPLPTRGRQKSRRGQTKSSVSSQNDSFVTPQKSRKSKKPAITFSSDEEEEDNDDAVMAESETPKVTTPISRSSRRTRLRN
ncbi:condensin complex subunit 1 isoform X2 [Fundulus heteroclitus]|uniref:condensin complex subunit 1 isoform X2 n=1 Tax=Fundulus heteroclitus TaxID=8078 RepID=UPI00165A2648|nr:condensin complex subunit 1 isoform X2 [Fundulus heteroclitus]